MIKRRMILFGLLMLAGVFVLAACGGRQSAQTPESTADVKMDFRVNPDPPETGNATLILTLTKADGTAINDANVKIRGDMSHAGMVPVLREVQGGATNGEYQIPFEWTMAGDWSVTVDVTLADGSTATGSYDYTVAAGANAPTMEPGMDMEGTAEPGMEMTMESTAEAGMTMEMTETPGMESTAEAGMTMEMTAEATANP